MPACCAPPEPRTERRCAAPSSTPAFDDIPANGPYVIGGLALGGEVPLSRLIQELRISKQAAGQLVDALVLRGTWIGRSTPTIGGG